MGFFHDWFLGSLSVLLMVITYKIVNMEITSE